LKYRDLRKILRRFDVIEDVARGKGSHRIFFRIDIDGNKTSFPIPCHNEGYEIHAYFVRRIREVFRITCEEFYG
ncbi:MAG: type II toxin-antitoxin system HicA family toxin, partial [Candidatus Omnitrophota bacterium]